MFLQKNAKYKLVKLLKSEKNLQQSDWSETNFLTKNKTEQCLISSELESIQNWIKRIEEKCLTDQVNINSKKNRNLFGFRNKLKEWIFF